MIQQINESEKNRILNLHRQHFILEDSGQSDIMDKALTGDFLRSNLDTQELFNKMSKLQPNLTYKNFLNWNDKKTSSRLWGICKEDGTGCGACARTLKKGGRTNENGECMEDVINFVRQKGDIKDLYTKFK